MTAPNIILASGSAIRADILRSVGIPFNAVKPHVDEDQIKDQSYGKGLDLEETAMALAEAKCMAVASKTSDIVIGSDQILEFEGKPFDKPKSMDEAHARLAEMAGKTHTLINAIAVARNSKIQWRHIDRPALYMRDISENELDIYIKTAGPEILSSVGAYQVENLGARLFEKIDGDFYAVLGLSLYPLLAFLRKEGAIAF